LATQVTNYQCPNCMGPLQFKAGTGQLGCDFCGSTFTVAEVEAMYAEKDAKAAENMEAANQSGGDGWDTSGLSDDWGADAANMRSYLCPACGAELICDATTAATSCPYCDNPTIVPGQFGGTLKPDLVLPFAKSKEEAIAALKKHYEGRPLLPNAFKDANHLEEIKGVYVPFWLFDGEAAGDAMYECTRVHTYKSGDKEVTETEHFNVTRAGKVSFEKIPVDGSTKMPDDYMDSIEPYDYQALTPFSTAYLPGYLADKYDVTAEDSSKRADDRAYATIESCLRDTVSDYSTVMEVSKNIKLTRGEVKYALLPVWMLSTKWNGQNYLFAMNGQTGKFVGNLPIDKKKQWLKFGICYGVAAAAAAIIMMLLGL